MVATTTPTQLRRVRRTLDDAGTSLVGRRVLAMCSGGSDSVALVALLGSLPRGARPASIDVLHVDHGLRDDTDAERVAAAAAARSIDAPFHPVDFCLDPDPGANLEAAAREARYDVALDLAGELGDDAIATGHTADDQLEQALLALLGVTGHAGAADAMPVARALGPGIELVRPLLGCTRAQLEGACRDAGLAWAVDPTNADPDVAARNAVRHRVVPALLDVQPDAGVAITRAGERARDAHLVAPALASALLDAWSVEGAIDVRQLAALPVPARRELLAAWLRRHHLGRGLTARAVAAVERVATMPGSRCNASADLAGGTCVRRDGYHLTIQHAPPRGGPHP